MKRRAFVINAALTSLAGALAPSLFRPRLYTVALGAYWPGKPGIDADIQVDTAMIITDRRFMPIILVDEMYPGAIIYPNHNGLPLGGHRFKIVRALGDGRYKAKYIGTDPLPDLEKYTLWYGEGTEYFRTSGAGTFVYGDLLDGTWLNP